MQSIKSKTERPLLVVTIEGAEVRNGRIEAEHLAKILEALQESLRCFTTQFLQINGSTVSKQERTLTQKYATFQVLGFTSDNSSINLALPRTYPAQDGSLAEAGRRALISMVSGLQLIASGGKGRSSINGNTAASLAPFTKLASLLQNGIQQIRLSLPETDLSAVLNENVCHSLEKLSFEESAELKADRALPRSEPSISQKLTAETLLHSPLIGIWSDRTDITNSSEFARELRDKAGSRER